VSAVVTANPVTETSDPDAAQDAGRHAHMHVAIVRMILAVYPVPTASTADAGHGAESPATESAAPAASNSLVGAEKSPKATSDLPAAPASDSGWLILQL
jgi:hypothetical protein